MRRVLFRRRMPARRNPLTSHHHCDRVVEAKRNDCRASTSRTADDLSAVLAPFEMPPPFAEPRIEQSYLLSSDRIERSSLSSFETVAHSTSKAKIPFAIRSTRRSGNDMLNFELAEHVSLRALAVLATMLRARSHASAQLSCSHSCSGCQRLAQTSPNRLAERLCLA